MGECVCRDCMYWKLELDCKQWSCQNIDSPLYGYKFLNPEAVSAQVSCVHWDDGYRPLPKA